MSRITIVGGITADIEGNPTGQLVMGDSNPGKISIAFGGVGRNITENLARLGSSVSFVSVAGDDMTGHSAVHQLQALGVDTEGVRFLEGESTAMYLSILNLFGEMELALCNMDILERVTREQMETLLPKLKESEIVGLDTNLTEEVLDYVTSQLEGIPLFLDPVSVAKAVRAKNLIGRFHTIKPNRAEAEALSGLTILNEEQLAEAGRWFADQGVKRIFITLSGGGVYYKEGDREGILRPGRVSPVSVTGAGDAFSAAVLDGYLRGMDVEETARYGMSAASCAMEARTAVNPSICHEEVKRRMAHDQ